MILKRAAGCLLGLVLTAGLIGKSEPRHPAVDAADAVWAQWQIEHSEWMNKMSWRERYDFLAEQASRAVDPTASYDWRLEARYRGLTLKQIGLLQTDGVVATGGPYFLSHKTEKPLDGVFVTTDMMLHAYSLMTADFVRGMEMQRAPRLRRMLLAMWTDLPQWALYHGVNPESAKAAMEHVQRVLAPALLCLGAKLDFTDSEIARDAQEQVKLITAAETVALPDWLQPADGDFLGIDYQRMKPVGFYPENDTLTGLFRAVRWLQAVPFRSERDNELVAFAILAELAEKHGFNADDQLQRQWLGLPNCLTVVGQKELSVAVTQALKGKNGNLAPARAILAREREPVHANDNLRLDPKLAGKSEKLPSILKVIPAYLTADAMLFSEVLMQSSRLPDGRMITALLGDQAAFTELESAHWDPEILEIIREAATRQQTAWAKPAETAGAKHPYDNATTFNSLLLWTWSALFLPPQKGAPDFLVSPAWRAKSRNTVLAAWAEKKHTWVLHEVEPLSLAGSAGPPPPPPGIIEPNPEFFRRLRVLTDQTITWMQANGFFIGGPLEEKAKDEAAAYLKVARYIHAQKLDMLGNTKADSYEYDLLYGSGVMPPNMPSENEWLKMTADDFSRLREKYLSAAEMILNGFAADSAQEELIRPPIYRSMRWSLFQSCVQKLAGMSAKQLRGEPWTDEENEYLTQGVWNDYGQVSMLGDDGRPPDPKSLGPKIAPVGMNPNTKEVLQVGTGDMAEIYVLYPWKGASFLYRGPIIPYYEFVSQKRLDDEEWKALLKSSNPPRQPAWLEPLWK